MNEQVYGLLAVSGMMWVVFSVIAGMIHSPWRTRLLWWPVKLVRRAVASGLRALADLVAGKK